MIGEVEVQTSIVINRRMTTRIVDKRDVCRSVIRVKLIIAGMSFNRRHTVMHEVLHGVLQIEIGDNVFC